MKTSFWEVLETKMIETAYIEVQRNFNLCEKFGGCYNKTLFYEKVL